MRMAEADGELPAALKLRARWGSPRPQEGARGRGRSRGLQRTRYATGELPKALARQQGDQFRVENLEAKGQGPRARARAKGHGQRATDNADTLAAMLCGGALRCGRGGGEAACAARRGHMRGGLCRENWSAAGVYRRCLPVDWGRGAGEHDTCYLLSHARLARK